MDSVNYLSCEDICKKYGVSGTYVVKKVRNLHRQNKISAFKTKSTTGFFEKWMVLEVDAHKYFANKKKNVAKKRDAISRVYKNFIEKNQKVTVKEIQDELKKSGIDVTNSYVFCIIKKLGYSNAKKDHFQPDEIVDKLKLANKFVKSLPDNCDPIQIISILEEFGSLKKARKSIESLVNIKEFLSLENKEK